ncbi:hypothetical protein DRE_06715 [Drechslerella stenobrocha 248]|uniref:Alpha-ketoglutarate-dependent dioxygenase AlkB-like domain-containing protein n=1 Tax=Drechslerella stenobrocha 248 TaxID=1043628 RepID=W7HXB6_9PEZI|nr:hypothetical protein DRE_06715 [Drechslerella stenobrocha 248]
MVEGRIITRSSRRLRQVFPAPPSPPKSETGGTADGKSAELNVSPHRISGLASPAPTAVELPFPTPMDVDTPRQINLPVSEYRITRSKTIGTACKRQNLNKPQIPPAEIAEGYILACATVDPGVATPTLQDITELQERRSAKGRITKPGTQSGKVGTGATASRAVWSPRQTKRKAAKAAIDDPTVSDPTDEMSSAGFHTKRRKTEDLTIASQTDDSVICGDAVTVGNGAVTQGQVIAISTPSPLGLPITETSPKKQKVTTRKNAKIEPIVCALTAGKPPSIGKPEVWCDTRQELCESLPSFRSYQGGSYASKGFCRGYLIDGHASERDYMDASIIISHAGGNSEEVEGERRLVRDQTWDKGTIAYLRNNCQQMVPIAVIVGERCPTAPAKLLHRYSVMDWFKVTHCWPERDSSSRNIRCKFRLEKLDGSQRGWWAAADTPGVSENIAVEYIKCRSCEQESPWVYESEPMCLNKDCDRFWTVYHGESATPPKQFVYRGSFLHGKTVWPDAATQPPAPLAPTLPVEDESVGNSGRDVKRRFWKGVWCQKCGKLNCREYWRNWKCTNCDWEFTPQRSHFIPADLSDPHRMDFTGPPIPENVVDPSIKSSSTVLPDGRRAITYELYQCGKVVHILANKTWNALPGGADWLLDKYQDVSIPFKRHELKTHKCTGRLLTQQFSFNSGAPYKYIVEVDSLSFEESPAVVQQALKTLQADVSRTIPDALTMNEVLNVAYFEEQKMDFHDDGEEDLGPCVSSISLGSPAMMYFRIKGKYCTGNLSAADKALLEPSNPVPLAEGVKRPTKRNVLELRLHHGDVMIMDGRPIQRLLEHAVTPEGFRIAATARNISLRNAVINSKGGSKRASNPARGVNSTPLQPSLPSAKYARDGAALPPKETIKHKGVSVPDPEPLNEIDYREIEPLSPESSSFGGPSGLINLAAQQDTLVNPSGSHLPLLSNFSDISSMDLNTTPPVSVVRRIEPAEIKVAAIMQPCPKAEPKDWIADESYGLPFLRCPYENQRCRGVDSPFTIQDALSIEGSSQLPGTWNAGQIWRLKMVLGQGEHSPVQ